VEKDESVITLYFTWPKTKPRDDVSDTYEYATAALYILLGLKQNPVMMSVILMNMPQLHVAGIYRM
jgi:hypothetical protein